MISVLVIGAGYETGQRCLLKLEEVSHETDTPIRLHPFLQDGRSIDPQVRLRCHGVHTGNAGQRNDIRTALAASQASWVILALTGHDTSRTDVRTTNAKALALLLQEPDFLHVKVIIISHIGASTSKTSWWERHRLRHTLRDHTGQEEALLQAIPTRTMILRPTSLTDDASIDHLVYFDETERPPSRTTSRNKLAQWIARAIVTDMRPCTVNITDKT